MESPRNSGALERAQRGSVDGCQVAHNPKVVGSNPTPATIAPVQRPRFSGASLVLAFFYRVFYRVEAGSRPVVRGGLRVDASGSTVTVPAEVSTRRPNVSGRGR